MKTAQISYNDTILDGFADKPGVVEVDFHDDLDSGGSDEEALSWVNSARIDLDDAADEVSVSVSVDDERGFFTMRLYRNSRGVIYMQVPHPDQGMLHMPLSHGPSDGMYVVG